MDGVDRYNSEQGLAKLESVLGLTAHGSESDRIDAIVAEVERRVCEWEKWTPSALLRDGDAISALFTVTDKVHVASVVNNGRLPGFWWAHLAVRLVDAGQYDRLDKQINRETNARMAQSFLKDERSMGGKAKAANAATAPAKSAIKAEWDAWQADRSKYKYPRDFRRAMTLKFPDAVDGTLKNWMSEWGRKP